MKQVHQVLVIALCLLPFGASAQWAWVDKDGKKVFSDRAPSAEVPDKSVFKRPGRTAGLTPVASSPLDAQAPSDKPAEATKRSASQPVAGVDKELADRIKKTEQDQADKKKAEEDRSRKVKADNCQRAKQAQKGLESGVRMSRINAQGEREVMDDATRSVESKRLEGIVQSECQ